jgi:4-amino-4-deoxy-L-arabinose transferase-like glycosyltransferase
MDPHIPPPDFVAPRAPRAVRWLIALVLAAALARLVNIDRVTFWTDEYRHAIAAQSLLAHGRPVIPEVGEYPRAFPVTWLTALSFRFLGEGEAQARLPFVLINLALLALVFAVVRRWCDEWTALAAAFVLAFSPDELQWGRECRMYALLQLLYFGGSVATLAGFESLGRARGDVPPALVVSRPLPVLALGIGLLAAAAWIQPLALNFPIAMWTYCLAMLLAGLRRRGLRSAARTRYAAVILLSALGVALVFLLWPSASRLLLQRATERPVWSGTGEAFAFYRDLFLGSYPALTIAFLPGCALVAARHGRAGLFLAVSFLPLLIVHMTAFSRFENRYLAYIFPFFAAVSAAAVVALVKAAAAFARWSLRDAHPRARGWSTALAGALVAAVFCAPWLLQARRVVESGWATNWKEASDLLSELSESRVVLTTWPQVLTWYAGRFPDYILIREGDFGEALRDRTARVGSRDIPIRFIRGVKELRAILNVSRDACVIADRWAFERDSFIDRPMRDYIARHLEPLDHGFDRRILIFEARR